ncbi:hypothetical protein [Alistipes finegoldii]|uniref:hypothetical protein n=1 Tax=Alistipes finegoldii TaxID=214856 RepID=UPI003977D8A1
MEHTTSAPDVHPAVVLTPGTPTSTTLSFTAALTDPETAAYVCLEKTEGTTVPTAEEILRDGTAIAQTGELLVENLKPATVYLIAAAVANTGVYSEVETLEMKTVARTPVVTVIAGTPTETTLSFHFKLTDAEKAAYVCIEKTDNPTIPSAEEILRDGTDLPVSADAAEIRELKPGTTYIVAVAASNKTVYSDVKTVEMTTDQAVEGPIVFDRQAAGGYYPTESSYIGEFLLVLADGETTESGGVYATTGAGRAMSIDLYQMAVSNPNTTITLPARDYRYATNKGLTTFDPVKTYCMVNDGKGNITRTDFKAGTISVKKAGSTYTITATLTTTDDEEFTASYEGPLTIENKTPSEIPDLPTLDKDVTNLTFIRALGKYYSDSATADNCIVNLYDVEPTISYGSDYLGQAGHMVSLDLSTAVSTEMQLQEGTYSVSTSGAPGSYAAGYQTEFMDTMLPVGTYCEERNDNFQSFYGFVSSGTVTITKSGSGYRFVLDFTTDKGHKVSGTYEGNVEMTDKR